MSPSPSSGIATTVSEVQATAWPSRDRKQYRPLICGVALFTADCVAMVTAILILTGLNWFISPATAALLHPTDVASRPELLVPFLAVVVFAGLQGRYSRRKPLWSEARLIVAASLCAAGATAVITILTAGATRAVPVLGALLLFPILATIINGLTKQTLRFSGLWTIPVVVIGHDLHAAETTLAMDRALGYRVAARIDPETTFTLSAANRLRSLLQRHGARHLIIAVEGNLQREIVERALRERVPFTLALPPGTIPAFVSESTSILGHDATLLSFNDPLSQPFGRIAKAAMDVVGAAVLLIVLSPVFLLLMLLCRLDGGPALFAHQRVGAGGRAFRCLKFRTMVVHADQVLAEALAADMALAEEWRATRKLTNDPRVTRIGRFLRNTSLDELPQLINVLRLEMSLVGPRPIVESEVALYGNSIAQYYATRPGLTGLWQVSGRSNTSYAKRVQLDVWYVNNWTVWHDFAVLLKTIPTVIRRHGAC